MRGAVSLVLIGVDAHDATIAGIEFPLEAIRGVGDLTDPAAGFDDPARVLGVLGEMLHVGDDVGHVGPALAALEDINITVRPGERRAVLGSNGAGKTTLFNCVTGDFPATTGNIRFFGEDISEFPPHERIRRGLRRTYQISLLFTGLSVRDNIYLSCVGVSRRRFSFLRPRRDDALMAAADNLVDVVHLTDDRDTLVSNLSYGQQRQLEIAMALGVDPRHADQMVRGVVSLPNGTGKTVRVAVFARGDKAEEAKKAGADIVGAEDLMETVQGGTIDFDRCIATPDMMPVVGRLGKVLGPRGLMPNPKVGTVTMDVKEAVEAAKGGQVQYKAEKAGVVHAGIGKASFDEAKLVENVRAFVDSVAKAKPSGAKGTYMKKIAISSTMGPGVTINVESATGY